MHLFDTHVQRQVQRDPKGDSDTVTLLASFSIFCPQKLKSLPYFDCLSMADVLGKSIVIPSGSRLNSLFTTLAESIHEIDSSISRCHHIISISSRSDPDIPILLNHMAIEQLQRYMLSNQKEDLDKAIFHFTEAILIPLLSWLQHGPLIIDALFFFAKALLMRSEVTEQPEDAIYATKYLLHLRDQRHETPITTRHRITELLVDTLVMQVKLEAGNMMQNIREMAVLSRELLTLKTSDVDTTHLIILIIEVVESQIHPGIPDQPLDEIIEVLRAARMQRPDLLDCRITLARSLAYRYCMTCINDDYEEAASILDDIIIPSSGNTQDEFVAKAQGPAMGIATGLAIIRSIIYETPEYLEEALYRSRTYFSPSSYNEYYSPIGFGPEFTAKYRFQYFGSIEGVEESSSNSPLSQLVMPENSRARDKINALLFGIRNIDDTTKIDEAVEKGRSILATSPDTASLFSFGNLLSEAFARTKKIEYLNESISVRRQEIEHPLMPATRFSVFPILSMSLVRRFMFFPNYRTQDLDEALELLSQYVSNARTSLPDRFRRACTWAYLARYYRHSSASTAYETALSLMQDTPLFSPTLQLQHAALAIHDNSQRLPLDYASYQLDHHQL